MAINYQGGNDAVITGSFGGLMQTLQRNYMAEQQNKQDIRKQRDAILLETQKDLAKINSNGIRKADLPEFDKMYGGIKDTYYKMLTAKTLTEQRALAMQINEGLGQINSLVAQSKEVQKWENGAVDNFKNLVGQRGERDYMTHVRSGFDKPSSQLNKEYFDSSPYLNRWDEQKASDAVTKAIGDGFKNAKNYTTLAPEVGGVYNTGERKVVDVTYRDRLNDDFLLNTVSNLYQTNKDVKGAVDEMISTRQAVDLNDALTKFKGNFNADVERVTKKQGMSAEKSKGATFKFSIEQQTPSEQISTVPLKIGSLESSSSTTRNEKGVLLSGNKEFYDPVTRERIAVGRSDFTVDYTQDTRLGITEDGKIVSDNDPKAKWVQNFAVAQMVDPTLTSARANNSDYAKRKIRTVIMPEGDRQLFGKSATIKRDAERRSKQNTKKLQVVEY